MSATSTTVRPRRRSRADIVRANDAAVRTAVIHCVAEVGWDAMTLSGVAKRAGLTVGAVYNRAESKSELGNIVWSDAIRQPLTDGVNRILSAAEAGDAAALSSAFDLWENDEILIANTVEFLIASLFDDELDEVVGADMRSILQRLRVDPDGSPLPAHLVAANTLNMSMAFGRLLARRSNPDMPALTDAQLAVSAAFAAARSPEPRPAHQPPVEFYRDAEISPEQQQIDTATLQVIARVGYRRATIARIARAAGLTTGSLFSHYDSKAQLVSEAVAALLRTPAEMWDAYSPVAEEHGPLIGRAMWVADVLRPENARNWALDVELARIGRFVPELSGLQAQVEGHHHTNLGVMLVGCFGGDLHDLPFEDPFSAGSTTR